MKFTALILFLTSFTAYSKPIWKISSDLVVIQEIKTEEATIEIEDWSCTVGKINLDNYKSESRRLGCSTNKGLQVYVNPICFYDKKRKKYITESSGFNLQMKHAASKFVSLYCE